jgi:4-hydroxy-tetrahydrodipicolinate synthase
MKSMKNSILKGTGVALVTPFKENLEIDEDAYLKLVEHVVKGGVDFLVLFGTTGESPTVSLKEKEHILRKVSNEVEKDVPIVIGFGGNNTSEITKQLEAFDFSGATAILSVVPYYNKPSQEGLIAHYQAIAETSPLPVILYNVPGRTVVAMEPETTLQLASHPNIIGIKEATDNLDKVMALMAQKPEEFLVFAGDDALTFIFLALGAHGTISVIANAYPDVFSRIVKSFMQGNIEDSRKYHYAILPLLHTLLSMGNPAGIKAILHMKDLIQHCFRLPLVPLPEKKFSELAKAVEQFEKRLNSI